MESVSFVWMKTWSYRICLGIEIIPHHDFLAHELCMLRTRYIKISDPVNCSLCGSLNKVISDWHRYSFRRVRAGREIKSGFILLNTKAQVNFVCLLHVIIQVVFMLKMIHHFLSSAANDEKRMNVRSKEREIAKNAGPRCMERSVSSIAVSSFSSSTFVEQESSRPPYRVRWD